jgi:Putative lumazine-binding
MSLEEYLVLVAGRQSPEARGDRRADEILNISIPSATTAHARVREIFLPKNFTDELTFVRADNQWKIVSKVWHFDLIASK